jgi:hypothetical protein
MRAIALLFAMLWSVTAQAQIPGNLPAFNVWGNPTGASAPAAPFPIFSTANTWQGLQTFGGTTTAPQGDGQVVLGTNNLSAFASTVYSPFSVSGGTIYDSGRYVLDLESVTGGTVSQANALGAYAFCNFNTSGASYPAKGNCVASYGIAVGATNGAESWGSNFYCSDNTSTSTYVGSGAAPRSCIGTEIDVRIQDSNGTALATGALISLVSSGGTSYSRGFGIDIEAIGLQWTFGINCGSGTISLGCLNVGAVSASGTSIAGQSIVFEYFNGSAVNKAMTMKAAGSGGFVFATTDASITNAMDWSSVTINTCAIKLSVGCIVNGNGQMVAAFGAGAPATPNLVLETCGTNCGWYSPTSGQMAWSVGGGDIMDFGKTNANTFSFDVNISLGLHSIYGGGTTNANLNFFTTYCAAGQCGGGSTPAGDTVQFAGSIAAWAGWTTWPSFANVIVANLNRTVASGASAVYDAFSMPALSLTVTGTTHVTTATGFNQATFYQPTYTDSSSVTIDNGATVAIAGAPIAAGSVTLSNAYALWVQAGTTKLAGTSIIANITATASGGLQVGSPTGGDKGSGTLNVAGTIWTNGTQGVSTTCTVTGGNTLVFTNGILTSKGANCT